MAKEVGLSQTARRLRVNRKTVKVWRNRLLEGKGFDSAVAPTLTVDEVRRVKIYILSNGIVPISEIQERVLPKRSKAAIYKILLGMNIPVAVPRLVRFHCNFCNEDTTALQIYFGLTKKPPCPICNERLTYISSKPLRIIGKIDSLFVLRKGVLHPPRKQDLALINKEIKRTDSTFPLYCKDLLHHPYPLFHMVYSIEMNTIHALCEMIIVKQGSLLSTAVDKNHHNRVCVGCVLKANERLNRGKPLKPLILPNIISKREIVMEAISLTFTLKNIKRACEFHKISRTTFYNYVRSLDLKDSLERMRHSL